jgi:hypothetical protein
MAEAEADRETKNRQIVEALRAAFAPLVERLTPEVEPATIYAPAQTPENEE